MVGFAAQTSNQPRLNGLSWRIDVATGLFREAVSREKDREESEMHRDGHGLSWRDMWKVLGRGIVVYKVYK